jgi:hypothetical protein
MDGINRSVQAAVAELRAKRTAEQAEQLLRCLGGDSITLRISTGLSADDARGLGMTAMSFEDVEFSPAMMITRNDGTRVVQIAAASVNRLAEVRGSKPDDMLASVVAVVRADELIPVKKIESQYVGIVEYIYNLVLSE